MHVSESELKAFILDSGLVSRKDVDAAEEEAKRRGQSVGDILIAHGLLTSDSLRRIKAYVLGIPFITLKETRFSLAVLSLIPEPIARARSIVAIRKTESALEVAMLDIEDLAAIDSVRKNIGLKILPRLTNEASMKHALLTYQRLLKEEFGDLISSEAGRINLIKGSSEGDGTPGGDLKAMAEDASIVRIVDTLLRHAIVQKASDIHIEPQEGELLVRYRIDGVLRDAMTLPSLAAPGICGRIKTLANLSLDETRMPQDGRFSMETEKDRVSFRVSVLPTYFGEKVVMRLLRETGEGFTLDVLGFHGGGLERVHRSVKQTSGLVLVAGPVVSGKTTTLYTILDILNTPDVSIATIEDPIEYQMKRLNQTQVNPGTGFTFANGLRALLRQDPDIVMVGDIRDAETAMLAVSAALSGRLVLAAISASSASDAIARMIDLGVESSQLSSTLRAVIGQRLVRALSGESQQHMLDTAARRDLVPDEHLDAALAALKEEGLLKSDAHKDDVPFYRPVSSEGYSGNAGVQEVLSVSSAIRDLILREASAAELEKQARKEGMLTMLEDGIYKAMRGVTSIEEAVRSVS